MRPALSKYPSRKDDRQPRHYPPHAYRQQPLSLRPYSDEVLQPYRGPARGYRAWLDRHPTYARDIAKIRGILAEQLRHCFDLRQPQQAMRLVTQVRQSLQIDLLGFLDDDLPKREGPEQLAVEEAKWLIEIFTALLQMRKMDVEATGLDSLGTDGKNYAELEIHKQGIKTGKLYAFDDEQQPDEGPKNLNLMLLFSDFTTKRGKPGKDVVDSYREARDLKNLFADPTILFKYLSDPLQVPEIETFTRANFPAIARDLQPLLRRIERLPEDEASKKALQDYAREHLPEMIEYCYAVDNEAAEFTKRLKRGGKGKMKSRSHGRRDR